jgi:putative ABC transport system substrate-binding protein
VKRRKFLLGTAALAALPHAFSQTGGRRRIGVLVNGSEHSQRGLLEMFRGAMKALGHAEGRDFVLDVRWNEGPLDGLDTNANDLLRAQPDVIVAWPVFSARAAHKHTRSVPIVMAGGAGAIELGLAASLARPGGNVTGIISRGELLVGKRFELLRAIAPQSSRAALVFSGQQLIHEQYMQSAREGAKSAGFVLIEQKVTSREAVPAAAAPLRAAGCEGFVVAWDALMVNLRPQLIDLAASLRVPAVYPHTDFAKEGGLASYSPHLSDVFSRAASFVDRILKGANPAELPIEQPSKFEVIINLKTAKALGITIPQAVLLRADEVIA